MLPIIHQTLSLNNINHSYKGIMFSAVLTGALAVSYYNFSTFYPKALAQVREVQGLRTDSQQLPVPYNAIKISEYNTQEGYVLTVKSAKTVTETKSFFENAMESKGWKLDNYGSVTEIHSMKFKKENQILNITMNTEEISKDLIITLEVSQD